MSDHADDDEFQRLVALEEALDPWSTSFMEPSAPQLGGSCLEVGAGAGSIARWMAGRVGRPGEVVALDTDTRFLVEMAPPVRVVQGDVTEADLGTHDLVHCRALLAHVPGRDDALGQMAAAVRPGGWLVVEEPFSFLDSRGLEAASDHPDAFRRIADLGGRLFAAAGVDQERFPMRLPFEFERLGLVEVAVEIRVPWGRGGGATGWSVVARQTLRHLAAAARGAGMVDDQQITDLEALLDDPNQPLVSMALVQVRGRR